jgi:CRISPR/Cas system CSM-associated protein Csm3 (group 7 of RAMP superfamily)
MGRGRPVDNKLICPECEGKYAKYKFPTGDVSGPCTYCRLIKKTEQKKSEKTKRIESEQQRKREIKKTIDAIHDTVISQDHIQAQTIKVNAYDRTIKAMEMQLREMQLIKNAEDAKYRKMYSTEFNKHPDYHLVMFDVHL